MILYLILSTASLLMLLSMYHLLLKRKGLFSFNRFYLLAALLLSFSIPLLQLEFTPENENIRDAYQELSLINPIPLDGESLVITDIEITENSGLEIALSIYLLISLFFLAKFFFHLLPLLPRKKHKGPIINGMQTVFIKRKSSPYSFFHFLYISYDQFEEISQNKAVLMHEKAHSSQYHSIDILLVEMIQCVFWFHPMIYMYRKAIKYNHEYLADAYSCNQLKEKQNYLEQLLHFNQLFLEYPTEGECIERPTNQSLSSAWGFITLKQRINMIQQTKTRKMKKISIILFSLSVGILLIASTAFKPKEISAPIQKLETHFQIGNDVPFMSPIKKEEISEIRSHFGLRMHPILKKRKMHTGIDIIAVEGTAIIATADGVIETSTYSKGYGHHVKIAHNDTYGSMYAHLSSRSVKEGDKVKAGDIIGIIGSSGKSIATHLHYEVIKDGEKVDPVPYFNQEEKE